MCKNTKKMCQYLFSYWCECGFTFVHKIPQFVWLKVCLHSVWQISISMRSSLEVLYSLVAWAKCLSTLFIKFPKPNNKLCKVWLFKKQGFNKTLAYWSTSKDASAHHAKCKDFQDLDIFSYCGTFAIKFPRRSYTSFVMVHQFLTTFQYHWFNMYEMIFGAFSTFCVLSKKSWPITCVKCHHMAKCCFGCQ